MNYNNLLFNESSYKFIESNPDDDIPVQNKELFKRYMDEKNNEIYKKEILEKTKRSESRSNSNTLPLNQNEMYSKFNANQTIPISLNGDNGIFKQKTIQREKTQIIDINSGMRDKDKYPNINDFTTFLGKTFFNVKSIKLISTEIPNTDQVIKELPIEIQNNIISWQNEEDADLNLYNNVLFNTVVANTIDLTLESHGLQIGSYHAIRIYNSKLDTDISITGIIDRKVKVLAVNSSTLRFNYYTSITQGTCNLDLGYPVYTVNIKPGYYSVSTLVTQMTTDFNLVKRRNGTGDYHFFTITANLDTDIITLNSVILTQLGSSPIYTTAGSTILTFTQLGHGYYTGDNVRIVGAKTIAGISSTLINAIYQVIVLDSNTFTIEVNVVANETLQGGGTTVKTGREAPFRILFDTENTKIQFNTGFPDEDSTDLISKNNPITTKTLSINNVDIMPNNKIRLTTTVNHKLDACIIRDITSISTGVNTVITTSTPHLLELPVRINMRNTNSTPKLNGQYIAIATGPNTFIIENVYVTVSGNTGQVLYSGDKINIQGLKTVPNIELQPYFFIEAVPALNQIDITFYIESWDSNSVNNTIIKTNQIFINHPLHGFNRLSNITQVGTEFADCKLYLPHTLLGSRTELVSIIDGPPTTNTVDILLTKHGLTTSDTIKVEDSTTVIGTNGVYKVQVIDQDTLRVRVIHSGFTAGTGTILTGDKIVITESNSLPKIDSNYYIQNRLIISNINTGIISSEITTTNPHNWSVGDQVTITESDSVDVIDGTHTIQSITGLNSFTIDIDAPVTFSGTTGIIVNNTRFLIKTGVTLTTPGSNIAGFISRNLDIIHYRIEPEEPNGNNIGGIDLKVLNGVQRPIERLIDINNYMIRIDEVFANKTITAGGLNVRIASNIHGYRPNQLNTDTGTSLGKLYRSISLEGEEYIFLVCDGLDCVLNNSGINDVFAKILLSELPGYRLYNTFVSTAKVFDQPINQLSELRFRFMTSHGYLFDFNNIDYSLSLEITEIINQHETSWVSSRTGNNEYKY